jgi:hypothetical protein
VSLKHNGIRLSAKHILRYIVKATYRATHISVISASPSLAPSGREKSPQLRGDADRRAIIGRTKVARALDADARGVRKRRRKRVQGRREESPASVAAQQQDIGLEIAELIDGLRHFAGKAHIS